MIFDPRLPADELASRYIDEMLKGDGMETEDRYIDLDEEVPGAAPGIPASLLLKFLPLLTELYDMIKQGHGEVPEFHVGGGAGEVIVGPIPIRRANG